MRYAIFTDIHANLEALEAVLAKIDEIAEKSPIDQIWFLGDLVGYGPNPNECITKLRERTDVIIAGNHDWAAVGKLDLDDFSEAARLSAEWTAEQLSEEHRTFLSNLPERLEIAECTLVHGSPYGPLWEYLTSDFLAERSFQYFSTQYCFVGHTHVPVIFQQPDTLANAPTLPLPHSEQSDSTLAPSNGKEHLVDEANTDKIEEKVKVQPLMHASDVAEYAESAYAEPETGRTVSEEEANKIIEARQAQEPVEATLGDTEIAAPAEIDPDENESSTASTTVPEESENVEQNREREARSRDEDDLDENLVDEMSEGESDEEVILNAEDRLGSEIEELLTLLGLSQSMISVTNEMSTPPEGHWEVKYGYRAIINPGGVGQPRDGNPRAAFMIYDTEHGFEFYRVDYSFEKTQEKIIKAGLPNYLAVRLAYGR